METGTINLLPYEILQKIFSYLTLNELWVCSFVCCKWNCVAYDGVLWENRIFKPGLSVTETDIIEILSQVINLYGFIACQEISDAVINTLCSCDNDMRILKFHSSQEFTVEQVTKIFTSFPHVTVIQFPLEESTVKTVMSLIPQNNNLESLCLMWCNLTKHGLFMPLSTGCESLKHLNLGCMSESANISYVDIVSILKARRDSLISLIFTCQCITPAVTRLIGECTSLEELHMVHSQCWTRCDLIPLQNLTHLKHLTLINFQGEEIMLSSMLVIGPWNQLVNLNISDYDSLSDSDVQNITTKCSNLKSLVLQGCENTTDESVKNFRHLSQLTKLDLSRWDNLTDNAMQFICDCKQLDSLILDHCSNLTDYIFLDFVRISKLQRLSIRGCVKIRGSTFHLIPKYLKLMTCFNVSQCKAVQESYLNKLRQDMSLLNIEA